MGIGFEPFVFLCIIKTMKRHRILKFFIDSSRNMFRGKDSSPLLDKYKEEQRSYIADKYGSKDFDDKFNRWMSIPNPVLSVVDEHTYLLQDIENSYVSGSLYSALTGACCLGERIFNQIISRIRESYRSSPQYKKVYKKDSINDWDLAIGILVDWKVIDINTEKKYRRLATLRNDSVHFQNKPQDLNSMAKEAITLINEIVTDLFGLDKDKKFIIWFEVPGELYLKKEAEDDPFIREFYIPCSPLVGFKHTIENTPSLIMKVVDNEVYSDEEIPDSEFVRLRNEY